MSHVVIFPVGKQAAASAYKAWTDQKWSELYQPGEVFAYCRNDDFGQWVVPYLGPPMSFAGAEVPEPAGGPAMRADGVLHDFAIWPSDDE
jgi:hypothetical protein